ncbi:hypothetical protein ACFLY4_05860 [Chloroflexota bacterium]
MTASIMLYVGSVVIILWGIAHIIPTKSVVDGFGSLSLDNFRIITMEWVAEGLTLMFIGILVLAVTWIIGPGSSAARLVIITAAGMLFVMAVWSGFTGARTSILPMKACPFVKSIVGILFILAMFL